MDAIVHPSKLAGSISAPASKSAMQRACAAALIKQGKTSLLNAGISSDDQASLSIIEQLGAKIERKNESILIESNGVHPQSGTIHCSESGLSVRMFTSIAALSHKPVSITGHGSLLKRPLSFFDEVLPLLKVQIQSKNGLLPLHIKGPLQPTDIHIDGSLSSQFLTGLLLAYSAADAKEVTIYVSSLNSKPYIDLTLNIMERFGLKMPINKKYEAFYFSGAGAGQLQRKDIEYRVEGDWSGGAFLLVAGALAGEVTIEGLEMQSTQADKTILEALRKAGAEVHIKNNSIRITPSSLKAFSFNATDCPDLFPPLVALAASCEGTTHIEGVSRLKHKESDRGQTLQEEFKKMGVEIVIDNNQMQIHGNGNVKGARTRAHHDHRIAMACAVAALRADSKMIISDADAVNKSYPNFWEHLQQLGANVSLHE